MLRSAGNSVCSRNIHGGIKRLQVVDGAAARAPLLSSRPIVDEEFPLPGKTSTSTHYAGGRRLLNVKSAITKTPVDLFREPINYQHQLDNLHSFAQGSKMDGAIPIQVLKAEGMNIGSQVSIHECPMVLRKDMAQLFPDRNTQSGPMTAITVAQRSKSDMAAWSEEMEQERETIIGQFVVAAEEICQKLQRAGYWADFIDPISGRPYLGPFTNSTLFETDERNRYFGYQIEDLGCCKVVSHPEWGSHAVFGTIFTSAPSDCHILKDFNKRK